MWEIYQERLKVIPVTQQMESRGITLNEDRLKQQIKEYTKESSRLGNLCVNIADTYGYKLELPKSGNSDQLIDFIFNVMKLPVVGLTNRGNPSLDKEAMAEYEAKLPLNSRELLFVKCLKDKRKRDTALSYIEGYQRYWKPHYVDGERVDKWWVLYPWLNPTGTNTLRFSSRSPNEQNISKKKGFNLRYMFGPPPGREWWSMDASNIELRLPAYIAGEQDMIDLFEYPDKPPYFGSNHLFFFDILHPYKWDRSDPQGLLKAKKKYADTWYQWTKNGDFAVQYNAQVESGTADRAYHMEGAQAKIEQRLSKIKQLSNRQIELARKYGYVETIPDRTVSPNMGYRLYCTRDDWGRVKPTVPLSFYIQGSAMWWTMKAMIRVDEFFNDLNSGLSFSGRKWPGGYYITMQVHDELVHNMPSGVGRGNNAYDYNLPIVRQVRELMEMGGKVDYGIPTPVNIEYHAENWSTGVSVI